MKSSSSAERTSRDDAGCAGARSARRGPSSESNGKVREETRDNSLHGTRPAKPVIRRLPASIMEEVADHEHRPGRDPPDVPEHEEGCRFHLDCQDPQPTEAPQFDCGFTVWRVGRPAWSSSRVQSADLECASQ